MPLTKMRENARKKFRFSACLKVREVAYSGVDFMVLIALYLFIYYGRYTCHRMVLVVDHK